MPDAVSIPSRFNGPLDSGNGGYCSGIAAALVDGVAEVSLRRPVPLETELEVARSSHGTARVLDGGALVMEARSVPDFRVELPAPPTLEQARKAASHYRGLPYGTFSRCFVCGLAREDAFGVFAGAVEERELVASPWTPATWTADGAGHVLREFLWAVLDCPTYFAAHMHEEGLPMSVLARMTARIMAPAMAGEDHIVIAWPIGADGRKRHAGSAVLSAEGEPIAVARALLIEPRSG